MAVVIHEIVTELVVSDGRPADAAPAPGAAAEEEIIRRATERVLEILRREWDR